MIRFRTLLALLAGALLLAACASKQIEERMANPQLRDLFPPLESAPRAAADGATPQAGAAPGAAPAAGAAAAVAEGAPATADAAAPAAGSTPPAAPESASAPADTLTFSPPKLDAPNSEQPPAPAPAPAAVATPELPAAAAPPAPLSQPGAPWPRAITASGVSFEVFEPQLQQWDAELLVADAVVTALPAGAAQPSTGVIRFAARTQVDRAAGTVALDEIHVTDARFQASPEQQKTWLELLRAAAPRQMTRVSLARLEQGAALMRARESARPKSAQGPPRIVLARNPVAVVNIDGEPQLTPITGTELLGVINTPALLLKDATGRYYLRVYDGWMSAPVLRGPWTVSKAPPAADVPLRMAAEAGRAEFLRGTPDPKTGALPSLKRQAPNVVVTTRLTVVVGVNGQAKWTPIPGTKLEYVANTKANVFRDMAARRLWVFAQGRWFTGTSTGAATWEFVPATKLPADLGRIPSGHPKAGIRAYLQESPEPALEAIAETPVLKEVSRKEVKFNVTIDGEPRFKRIEGTSLSYLANASAPVIQVRVGLYYGVQNGVWFTSERLIGPWEVTDNVPPEIYAIPPSSPIYHAVTSRVYASSTDKVYFGYNADPNSYRGGAWGAEGVAASDAAAGDVHFGYGYGWGVGGRWAWGWPYY